MSTPEDRNLIPLSSVMQVIRKNRKKILLCMLVCACFAFFYRATRPTVYKSEGTFKDKGKNSEGLSRSISTVLFLKDPAESEAMTLMRSRMLVERLVLENGMQAQIVLVQRDPFQMLRRIRDNVLVEYAVLRNHRIPSLSEHSEGVRANHVVYKGEIPLHLQLTVNADNSFSLFDGNGKIGDGIFGVPYVTENFSVNFIHVGESDQRIGDEYLVALMPLGTVANDVMEQFNIEFSLKDKGLVKIAYLHPDRHLSSQHIKDFIRIYLDYLIKEHQDFVDLQMSYLQRRQNHLNEQIENDLQAYAKTLTSDLSSTGFTTSSKALQFLAENQQKLKQKLLGVEMDIQRLENIPREEITDYEKFVFIPACSGINKFVHERHALKKQADSIGLALMRSSKQKLDSQAVIPSEFVGINLSTAQEIYIGYNKELNQVESEVIHERFIIRQLNEPSFEISSLSSTLKDPVSTEIIAQTSRLTLSLKDSENLSMREQDRIRDDLAKQKTFLKNHLEQNIALLELQKEYLQGKINALQSVNWTLTNEQMTILESQIKQHIFHATEGLKDEQKILKQHLSELKIDMTKFPQKWVAERLIEQKMTANHHLMEEMVKLVETKNVNDNLEIVKSTPIDMPITPIHPKPPYLLLYSVLGAILGAIFSISWFVLRTIKTGIETSPDALKLIGQHVSGTISSELYLSGSQKPALDSDLEALRRLLSYISNVHDHVCIAPDHFLRQSLLVLKNHGPNYVDQLAGLMVKKGMKVLLMNLCFDQVQEENKSGKIGLLDFLEGRVKDIEIIHTPQYDKILSGGVCRHANELLSSRRFVELVDRLNKNYDWIIAYSNAPLEGAEAQDLLDIFHNVAVSVHEETLSQLQGCVARASQPGVKMSFLFF